MTAAKIEAAFPLTPLQEGMLYHTIRSPAGLFHVQCSVVLDGLLVREHFTRAWELAVARHAALRTFFSWQGRERPLQVVRADAPVGIDWHDWAGDSEEIVEQRWRALLQKDRERGFDLATAPLLRLALVRCGPRSHRLLWAMYHPLIDGWSGHLLLDEIIQDYRMIAGGGQPASVVALRFDRLVGWLEAQDRARDEAYWRRTLSGNPGPTALPGDGRARTGGSERVESTHVLTAEETRQLRAAAARLRVTVNTMLMGAWAVMLARHADEDEVLIGVTVSERPASIPGIERAVGLYLSTVPVRVPAQCGKAVGDWLRALQLVLGDARAHGAPGLAAIGRWSAQPAGTALFQNLVVFENFPVPAVHPAANGDRASDDSLRLSSVTANVPNDVPLVLLAFPGERLVINVVHDPAVVPSEVAARLPGQLAGLLEQFGGDPARLLDTLTALGPVERGLLVDDWSGAAATVLPVLDVLERFERHASSHPEAVALQTETGTMTYGALDRHANRLGHRLIGAGWGGERLVGVLAVRSVEAIAAMLACLKVGAAFVALDPEAPTARLERKFAALDVVLATQSFAHRLPTGAKVLALDEAESLAETSPVGACVPSAPAYVVFTSGSTGDPKGVLVERGQLAASNAARDRYYPEAPRSFMLLSPITVDSAYAGIFWTLGTGGTLVLPRPHGEQDLEALAELVEHTGATHTLLVPSLHRTLLEYANPRHLASLRTVIVAGEACSAETVALHHQRLPGVALHNEYGPSEATVWATGAELVGAGTDSESGPVTIGRPVPGVLVYLLDAAGRPAPSGSIGEICLGGPTVARGYLSMPEETARRFLVDPFRPGGRLYRTGDRGRFLPDGRIEFLGRRDDQLKVRGFRVEPAEIERALLEYPTVREAAVALLPRVVPADPAALALALAAMPKHEADQLLREVEAMP